MKNRNTFKNYVLICCIGAMLAAVPAMGQLEFADAEFFIEINATDGDAGVQLNLDGEGWNALMMEDPNGEIILGVVAKPSESIGMQGLTEFFFESAEPSFDDQTLAELFALFPEGTYRFFGVTTEGDDIEAEAELTHNLPGQPQPTAITRGNHMVTIKWPAVESEFVDPNGAPVGDDIEIDQYILVVEVLDEEGEGQETMQIEVPPDLRRMTLPKEFVKLSPEGAFKFEVIAKEESGNQTIFEGFFELDD